MTTNKPLTMTPSAVAKSVIQQEIIDGLFYWDKIGPDWYRLLHRESQDVVGHYRSNYGSTLHNWTADY